MWEKPSAASPNATLQAKPAITDRQLRDALSNRLRGLAVWDDDTLRHTDPNGTAPMSADLIAEIWEKGLPANLPLRQKEAFIEWVKDSGSFQRKRKLMPGSDRWDDMINLVERLENSEDVKSLWRGMSMTRNNLEKFIKDIEKGYTVRSIAPAESWSSNVRAAEQYAGLNQPGGKWSVVLEVANPTRAKDITPLVRRLSDEVSKVKVPSIEVDAEWLYQTGKSFDVLKVDRDKATKVVRIRLRERD